MGSQRWYMGVYLVGAGQIATDVLAVGEGGCVRWRCGDEPLSRWEEATGGNRGRHDGNKRNSSRAKLQEITTYKNGEGTMLLYGEGGKGKGVGLRVRSHLRKDCDRVKQPQVALNVLRTTQAIQRVPKGFATNDYAAPSVLSMATQLSLASQHPCLSSLYPYPTFLIQSAPQRYSMSSCPSKRGQQLPNKSA